MLEHMCNSRCYNRDGFRTCRYNNEPGAKEEVPLVSPLASSEITTEQLELIEDIKVTHGSLIYHRGELKDYKKNFEMLTKKLEETASNMEEESKKIQILLDKMGVLKMSLFEALRPIAEVQVPLAEDLGRLV